MRVMLCFILLLLSSQNLFSQFQVVKRKEDLKEVSLYVKAAKEQPKEVLKERVNDTIIAQKKEIEYKKTIVPPLNREQYITSSFGNRMHPIDKEIKFHSGVDLRAKQDTVFAVFGGEVKFSGYSKNLGYYVRIDFKEYSAIYGHLSEYYVLSGVAIQTGDKIGLTGNTGKSTAEHLHFTLKKGDKYINPKILFNYLNN